MPVHRIGGCRVRLGRRALQRWGEGQQDPDAGAYRGRAVKTLLAARAERRAGLDPATERTLAAALNRFIHSPLKRKHARCTARQALAFVAKG